MSSPLVLTKLIPPAPRTGDLPRPALMRRLTEGSTRRLTLISAPAGFGKTTLLSAWIAQRTQQVPVAWLGLDASDDDPVRLMTYISCTVHQALVPRATDDGPPFGLLPHTQADQLAVDLVNHLGQQRTEVILVLDDLHWIEQRRAYDALAFLLEYAPPTFHLIISTREDPPLPLARLRAADQLVEIRFQDLRFSRTETDALLRRTASLTSAEIDALDARLEGWPAGLTMAALALGAPTRQDDPTARTRFIQAFSGSNRYIFDYLLEEVLERQPPSLQAFLLETSVLARMNGPLCQAVTAQRAAPAMLQQLERANLFVVPLDDTRTWYRYHRLFADLLHARLQNQYEAAAIRELHRRASAWFAQDGDIAAAVEHALAARDFAATLDLIDDHAQTLLMRGETVTLLRWLAQVPDALLLQHQTLCLYQAWALLLQGEPLHVARARLDRAAARAPLHPGHDAPLRAVVAILQGDTARAQALAQSALTYLPAQEHFLRSYVQMIAGICALVDGATEAGLHLLQDSIHHGRHTDNAFIVVKVLCYLADFETKRGHLHRANARYEQALATLGPDADRSPLAVEPLVGLGDLARLRGDWDTASRRLSQALDLAANYRQATKFDALLAMATLQIHLDNADAAEPLLAEAAQLAHAFDATRIDDLIAALAQAALGIVQGRLDDVEAWARARGLLDEPTATGLETPDDFIPYHLRKYEQIVVARLRIAQGDSADARVRLDALLPVTRQTERRLLEIEVQVLRAVVLDALGQVRTALHALRAAIDLAQPEEIVAPFVTVRRPLLTLLPQLPRVVYATDFVARLERILQQSAGPTPSAAHAALQQSLPEPLTTRELDILRLLDLNLTAPEIARRLTIGESTVRTHIKHIYAKLGVSRRLQAVDRARALGLTTQAAENPQNRG